MVSGEAVVIVADRRNYRDETATIVVRRIGYTHRSHNNIMYNDNDENNNNILY